MAVTTAGPVHPDLLLMFLADARLPTSGHTQSAGLEPAIECGGLAATEVADYCRTRLRTVARVDAGTAVVTRALVLAGSDALSAEIAWEARTPSPAQRAASRELGRAYRRLVEWVWPEPGVVAELSRTRLPSRPRVLGVLAAHLGLAPESLARLVAYEEVQSVMAASLKLVPGDPAVVSATGLDLLAEVDDLVRATADLTEPDLVPAPSAPLSEQWCEAHAHLDRRLFRA